MHGLIGLEIHTYLLTKEKLFCRCKALRERGLQSNIYICPICTGQPGAKPMAPNIEALKKSILLGLMLGCHINNKVKWTRKHYDWPDLPKGYQTTMSGAHSVPLGFKGEFDGVRVSSMHLEEDPASWDPQTGCVDYNRSGLPLVEIVTAPVFHFAEEVTIWLHKLVHALSYLKIVDSNAGIKVDVNVNIPGKTERVEIKNLNSIDNIFKAIEYEFERQEREGSVKETRRFDEGKGKTFSMRKKEGQEDYRFISDPDLQEIVLDNNFIEGIRKNLPETPDKKLGRLIKRYKIDAKNAKILSRNIDIVEFFENVVENNNIEADFALHWVTGELMRVLNWNKKMLHDVEIKSEHFAELLRMVEKKVITELQAKQILNRFVPKSFSPGEAEGKIDDEKELKKIADKIIKSNKKAVEDYNKGDKKALDFLLGEIMKTTNRRADYKIARKLLENLLKAE